MILTILFLVLVFSPFIVLLMFIIEAIKAIMRAH